MTENEKRVVHDAKMEDEMEDRFADAILRGINGPNAYAELPDDEPVAIVELMAEGGGETVYGQCKSGTWSYWRGGSSWGLDENDDEFTKAWRTDSVDTLDAVMPEGWFWLVPRNVNAESRAQLIDWYEHAVTQLGSREQGVLKDRWRKGLKIGEH